MLGRRFRCFWPARSMFNSVTICWALMLLHITYSIHMQFTPEAKLLPDTGSVKTISRVLQIHDPWPEGSTSNRGFFSFLYLKKLKFQKYMAVSKNFKTIPLSPPAWATGACRPLPGRQDLNVKKITFRSWRPGRIKQQTCKIDIKS